VRSVLGEEHLRVNVNVSNRDCKDRWVRWDLITTVVNPLRDKVWDECDHFYYFFEGGILQLDFITKKPDKVKSIVDDYLMSDYVYNWVEEDFEEASYADTLLNKEILLHFFSHNAHLATNSVNSSLYGYGGIHPFRMVDRQIHLMANQYGMSYREEAKMCIRRGLQYLLVSFLGEKKFLKIDGTFRKIYQKIREILR